MKVVFAGPSLHGVTDDFEGIEFRPPAAQGDLYRAAVDGATVIGLVDGYFGSTASVWHKEILFALGRGVAVIGGASMGALRAAECAPFGMMPIGRIAAAYLSGEFDDDGLVAICHAPAELGFAPTTEALVDARATIDRLEKMGHVSEAEAGGLRNRASLLFFADRTLTAMLDVIELPRRASVEAAYLCNFVPVKQTDALAVVDAVRRFQPRPTESLGWAMRLTPTWLDFVEGTVNG